MATYGDMTSRIGDEIQDASLSVQVQRAIQDAIAVYEPKRFYFNQSVVTFNTVPNQEYYGASDFPPIPLLIEIDSIIISIKGVKAPMAAEDYWRIDGLQTGVLYGVPSRFTYYGQQIRLFPIPNDAYPLTMSYHSRLSPLVAPTDTNAWMNDGEMLIRQTAKSYLAVDVLQEPNIAQGAQLLASMALDRLQMEGRKRRSNSHMKTDLPISSLRYGWTDIGATAIMSTGPAGMGIISRQLYLPAAPATLLNTDAYVFVHNQGPAVFLTPPVAPTPNQTIWIKDADGTAGVASIGLTGTVDGQVNPVLIDTAYGDITLVFQGGGLIQRKTT